MILVLVGRGGEPLVGKGV